MAPNLVPARRVPGAGRNGRNTLETLLFRGLSTPVALLLVVIQSRFLEPAGRGAFVLAVLSVTILSRLLGQLGAAVTNRLRHGEGGVRSLVLRALVLDLLLGVAASGVIVVWGYLTEDIADEVAVLAALALLPNVVWQTLSGVLLGIARVRLWNYLQLASPLLTLVAMLVLVVGLDAGVRGAVGGWAGAQLATALLALALTRDLWLPLALPTLGRHGFAILRLGLLMGAVQVVNLVSYRIELFILRSYRSLADVGVYSIAMQAAESMWLVAAAVATAVTAPAVHESEGRAGRLIARAAARGLLYTAAVALAVGAAAPLVIPLALGDDFAGAVAPLAVLLPGVVAYAPVSILVVYLSVRRGRPKLSLAVSLLSLVLTTAGSVVLIPPLGVTGAALASSVGYAAGGLLAWAFFVRLAGLSWLGRRPAPTTAA